MCSKLTTKYSDGCCSGVLFLTSSRLVSAKMPYILKKIWSCQLQVCLGMYDFLVDPRRYIFRSFPKGNLQKSCSKNACTEVFFVNKFAECSSATLSKKRFWHWSFPVNFSEYFFLEHLWAAASVSFLLMFNNKINPLSLSGNSIRSGCQMQLKVQPVNSHS